MTMAWRQRRAVGFFAGMKECFSNMMVDILFHINRFVALTEYWNLEQLIEFAGNHTGLVAGLAIVTLLLVWFEISRHTRGYAELTPLDAVRKMNQGGVSVVDLSTAAEFSKGHLSGSKNIVLSRINDSDPEVNKMKTGPVLVVCKNGNTAHQAAARLVKLGVTDVAVLKGGTAQWKADQFPLESK